MTSANGTSAFIWKFLGHHCGWRCEREIFFALITPEDVNHKGQSTVRVTINERSNRDAILAIERITGIRAAKIWAEKTLRQLETGGGISTGGIPEHFEVSCFNDQHDNDNEREEYLNRRVAAEARRKGLREPKVIRTYIDRLTVRCKPITVWTCEGKRAPPKRLREVLTEACGARS